MLRCHFIHTVLCYNLSLDFIVLLVLSMLKNLHISNKLSGSTIIEENMQGWDRESEKKLSDSEEVGTTYSRKLVSFCDCCQSVLRSQHELREHPTTLELIKYAFTCPPHGKVVSLSIIILLTELFPFFSSFLLLSLFSFCLIIID